MVAPLKNHQRNSEQYAQGCSLTPVCHTMAVVESTCTKKPARLNQICGLPARGAIENIADRIVNLIKECHEVALQVCTTKSKPTTSKHFRIRRVSNLRKSLCNKLKSVRHV
eukprot:1040080-Pelagomonas_calceolata.AAC.1